MIVLAFNGVLGADARSRIQHAFEQAKRESKVVVVEDCHVLSDDPTNNSVLQFDDGTTMFVPHGLSKQAVIEAIRQSEETTR